MVRIIFVMLSQVDCSFLTDDDHGDDDDGDGVDDDDPP